jgi:hypothetical protein
MAGAGGKAFVVKSVFALLRRDKLCGLYLAYN